MPTPATSIPAITLGADASSHRVISRRGVTMTETLQTTFVLEALTESIPK